MLASIVDFLTPSNLTHARLFRDSIKTKSDFAWNQTVQDLLDSSKGVIVKLVEEDVSTFDVNRVTCLAEDWSKDDFFLLVQKYCSHCLAWALNNT